MLSQIPPLFGQANVELQMQLLAYAKLGGDKEQARKAALRLTTLRLSPEEKQTLASDLRALGLDEKANLIAKQNNTLSRRTNGNSTYEQYQLLRTAIEEKQKDQALAIARGILNDDPLQLVKNEYIVGQAFGALQTFEQLDAFIAETTSAAEKSPEALRLNYLLANAWQILEAPRDRTVQGPQVTLPCWLKLERTGGKFTGSYSTDGQTWSRVGSISVSLEQNAFAGVALVGREPALETYAEFGSLGIASASTAEEKGEWKSGDIGRLQKKGKLEVKPEGVYRLQAGAGWIGFEADAVQFLQQPLSGDGSVTVRFLEADKEKGFGEAGLMFRSTLDPKSPSVSLVATPGQKVRLKYRGSNAGLAERYWRKLVELRPSEKPFQKSLASWLLQLEKKDEAFALYGKLMEGDPDALMEVLQEVTPLYQNAGRLPELAEKVAAWRPSPKSNRDWSWALVQLMDRLQQAKRFDLVEKVARSGLTYSQSQPEQATTYLFRALQELKKPEEAKGVLLAYFKTGSEEDGKGEATLGFSSNGRYIDRRPKWLRSIGMSTSGISIGGMQIVELARGLGMLEQVREVVRTQKVSSDLEGSSKVMQAYLGIELRDPKALEEVKAIVNSEHIDDNTAGLLMEVADKLKSWPGQAKEALRIDQAVEPLMQENSYLAYGKPAFLRRMALTQEQLGDAGRDETIRKLTAHVAELSTMRGNRNRREFDLSEGQEALALLLRAGWEKEYIDFLALMKATPEGGKLGWTYDEEQKIFRGEAPKPQVMLWLNETAEGSASGPVEIRYEIRREHPYDHGDRYKFLASRGRSIKALEKERSLKLLYGKTPETLQPIGELSTTKANGSWKGELPKGGGWLRGVIVEKDGKGKETEFASPMVPITRAPNLIQNAGFTGLEARPASGNFEIPGWKALRPGFWAVSPAAGPVSGGAVQCEWAARRSMELLGGERIPVEAHKTYLQTAWVRPWVGDGCEAEIGRRYLDVEGKELKVTYFPSYNSFNWRWHGQRLVPEGTPGAEKDADVIPAAAAFVVPILKVTGGAEWAGLYLGSAD